MFTHNVVFTTFAHYSTDFSTRNTDMRTEDFAYVPKYCIFHNKNLLSLDFTYKALYNKA